MGFINPQATPVGGKGWIFLYEKCDYHVHPIYSSPEDVVLLPSYFADMPQAVLAVGESARIGREDVAAEAAELQALLGDPAVRAFEAGRRLLAFRDGEHYRALAEPCDSFQAFLEQAGIATSTAYACMAIAQRFDERRHAHLGVTRLRLLVAVVELVEVHGRRVALRDPAGQVVLPDVSAVPTRELQALIKPWRKRGPGAPAEVPSGPVAGPPADVEVEAAALQLRLGDAARRVLTAGHLLASFSAAKAYRALDTPCFNLDAFLDQAGIRADRAMEALRLTKLFGYGFGVGLSIGRMRMLAHVHDHLVQEDGVLRLLDHRGRELLPDVATVPYRELQRVVRQLRHRPRLVRRQAQASLPKPPTWAELVGISPDEGPP